MLSWWTWQCQVYSWTQWCWRSFMKWFHIPSLSWGMAQMILRGPFPAQAFHDSLHPELSLQQPLPSASIPDPRQSLGCPARHTKGTTPGKAQLLRDGLTPPHSQLLGSTDSSTLWGNIHLLLLPQTLSQACLTLWTFSHTWKNEAGTLQTVFVTTYARFNPRRDRVLCTKWGKTSKNSRQFLGLKIHPRSAV